MSNIPKSCDECHDKEWCDNLYCGIGCNYRGQAVEEFFKDVPEEKEQDEDVVKEPSHYKHGTFETIDEMLIVFGPQKTYDYCVITAWKYRARAGYKNNFEQDMAKANQFLEFAKEIQDKNPNAFFGCTTNLIKEG